MNHRIEQYLDEHHVPYEVLNHRHTATSMHSAHAAHVVAGKMVKGVLLEGDDCYMAALIPADQDIRLGLLKMDFGEHLHLADESTVRQAFADCDPGAVPSLPMAWGVDTVWDDELLTQPDIYLEAGDHQRLIHVETSDLLEILWRVTHCHWVASESLTG